MQEKATEFLQGVLAIAREEHLMSEGRLMSAAQVAEALSASTPWNPLLAGWFLCGDIHPELFAGLKAGLQAQPLVAIKEGDTGVHYLLFAQRSVAGSTDFDAAGWQVGPRVFGRHADERCGGVTLHRDDSRGSGVETSTEW